MNNFYTLIKSTSDEVREVVSEVYDYYLSYPIKKRSGKYRREFGRQKYSIILEVAAL